jgi:hypothetical protein
MRHGYVQLPTGWEQRCLVDTLADAGLAFDLHYVGKGIATLRYGPDTATSIELVANVGPGAFCILAPAVARRAPTLDALRLANEVSIDWAGGRVGFDPAMRSFSAMSTLFAYPDHTPTRGAVQSLCHALWKSGPALSELACPLVDFLDPVTEAARRQIVQRFVAAGIDLQPQADGSFARGYHTDDDGDIGLRLSFANGAVVVDALPLRCPPWPETVDSMTAMLSLNHRLLAGAVTRWGEQIVVRQSVPIRFVPDHPQWVPTIVDAASWAALDVVRLARGGPLERPAAS